jgi:arylsulfatase A-like enzyme
VFIYRTFPKEDNKRYKTQRRTTCTFKKTFIAMSSKVYFALVVFCCTYALLKADALTTKRPNIIFILADDLGWNDVSFHGSSQIPTPHIDAIGQRGAYLNAYYTQPVCSPTRATLMTGRSVIRTGVYDPVLEGNKGDLSLNFTMLPQLLKKFGYTNHMVGKWHLGMSSMKFTPLGRGFDTYTAGYLAGAEDYWTHGHADGGNPTVLDFWNGTEPQYGFTCQRADACPYRKYSTHVFAEEATRIIRGHEGDSNPFFMYLAFQGVHAPLLAPQAYIDSFNSTIENPKRRIFAGMVKALDEGIGNVTRTLTETGQLDDTLVIFSTDNGGPADFFNRNMASNWPLRGMKRTLFEGGVRAVGAIAGAGINRKGDILDGLVHVADFLPSIISSLGGNVKDLGNQDGDGIDVWAYLSGASDSSPRNEILHEAHPEGSTDGNGNALRMGIYKIVLRSGSQWSTGSRVESNDGWYGGPGSSDPHYEGAYTLPTGAKTQPWSVHCPPPPADIEAGFACERRKKGQTKKSACLFDVKNDPCEHRDLSQDPKYKDILDKLWNRLSDFRPIAVDSRAATKSPDPPSCPGRAACTGSKCNGMTANVVPCP